MSMFERYLSEEFDDNYDDCLKDMKDKLAVRKKGTGLCVKNQCQPMIGMVFIK